MSSTRRLVSGTRIDKVIEKDIQREFLARRKVAQHSMNSLFCFPIIQRVEHNVIENDGIVGMERSCRNDVKMVKAQIAMGME